MSLLLDTHAALWFFQADPRLPASTRERIEEAGTDVHVSVASLWEIAIKVSLIPIRFQDSIERIQGQAVREVTEAGELANASSPAVSCSRTASMLA